MSTALLDREQLEDLVHTRTIGRHIEIHDSLPSTNTLMRRRLEQDADHGLVIFAEHQSAGRGRGNHRWHSPKAASILCSAGLLLEPQDPAARSLVLWSTLAVRDAVLQSCNVAAVVKWPNDLVVGTRKLCGLLVETFKHHGGRLACIIGIGINCLQHARHFQPDIREHATSLDLECSRAVDRLEVARALVTCLDHRFHQIRENRAGDLRTEFVHHGVPIGQRVRASSAGLRFDGTLLELDAQGGILMQLDEGGRRLFSPFTTTIEQLH